MPLSPKSLSPGLKPLPIVVENAERLREILSRLDQMTADIGTVRVGNSVAAKYDEIVQRAALVRQREALDAVVTLCETGHSAFAVCLLRPAYEELLWLEYLAKHKDVANDLLIKAVKHGIAESLEAQTDFIGRAAMQELGFSMRFVKVRLAADGAVVKALRELGAKLGWRQGADSPSVAYLAKQVGREKEYPYLYRATSRFVHFSPHELVRRAWGDPNEVKIGSSKFVGYWSAFALHWGLRIYVETFAACADLANFHGAGPNTHEELLALIEAYVPPVPIITREELEWPWSEAN